LGRYSDLPLLILAVFEKRTIWKKEKPWQHMSKSSSAPNSARKPSSAVKQPSSSELLSLLSFLFCFV
jgi:hypothetical protein